MELSFILPAILFTLLAIILVTALFSTNDTSTVLSSGSAASKADHSGEGSLAQSGREDVKTGLAKSGPSVNLTEKRGTAAGLTLTDKSEEDSECRSVGKIMDPMAADRRTVEEEGLPAAEVRTHAAHEKKVKSGIMSGQRYSTSNPASAPVDIPDMEVVEVPLKYVPGMLRTSHMEKMMTKEELEEEQRVQREQLAAIFQLLKENQETFGEVSEGDVEEQLRLYSI
uniref:matrix-remodeling-associated protein 7-like isoform X3 n=1 Tax=Oncorhynchus gorbuscha TaxID=8017 RepID=UPI001EAF46B4|nr:matrix-remodeling-associated protein 7-like isoform X3 [Oncorhynchus gorbuscha]